MARSIVVRQREHAPTLLNVVPVPEAMTVTIECNQRSHLRGPAVRAARSASEVVWTRDLDRTNMCPRTPASSVFERPWFTGPGWLAWMPVVCVLLCPPPAAGQTASAATGVIGGVVSDATGGVLPGVNVTVTSSALMGARTTITSHTGAFRFAALPPGVYALAFACPGFAPAARGGVYVAAGFTATLDVKMALPAIADAVRVERPPAVIDRQATSAGGGATTRSSGSSFLQPLAIVPPRIVRLGARLDW